MVMTRKQEIAMFAGLGSDNQIRGESRNSNGEVSLYLFDEEYKYNMDTDSDFSLLTTISTLNDIIDKDYDIKSYLYPYVDDAKEHIKLFTDTMLKRKYKKDISGIRETILKNTGVSIRDKLVVIDEDINNVKSYPVTEFNLGGLNKYDDSMYLKAYWKKDENGKYLIFTEDNMGYFEEMGIDIEKARKTGKKLLDTVIEYGKSVFGITLTKDNINAEGGFTESVINSDKVIKLYRRMNVEEYQEWKRTGIIPSGKFFADNRRNAVGVDDFDYERTHDVRVFSFKIKAEDLIEDIDGVYQTAHNVV